MIGQVLDNRFRIDAALAEGAYGKVYRGTDLTNKQVVAIKILTPHQADPKDLDQYRRRFEREIRLLAELNHPNAVKVLASGYLGANFTPYLAMEFVDGLTLTDIVARDGRIIPEKVARYLHQIAKVLDYAHSRHIVHRDIKPSNVMVQLSPDGREIIKVLDFGVAKLVDQSGDNQTVVTMAGVAVGTPDYMSPEQAMGKELDHRADIYALGVTLYAILTAYLPFTRKNEMQTMFAHVKDPVPRFNDMDKRLSIPLSVEAVVRRALAKNPDHRPQSVGELARMFQHAVDNPNEIPAEFQSDAAQAAAGGPKRMVGRVGGSSKPGAAVATPIAQGAMQTLWTVGLIAVAVAAGALIAVMTSYPR